MDKVTQGVNVGNVGTNLEKLKVIEPNQLVKHNSNINLEVNTSGPDSLIVMDPKRRRVNLDHDIIISKAQEHYTDMKTVRSHTL